MAVPARDTTTAAPQVEDASGLLALGRNPTAASMGAKAYLQIAPAPGILLRHAPANWEVGEIDGVPYWLPEIGVQPKKPGTPGMRTTREGDPPEAGWEEAIYQGGRAGWVYPDLTRPVPTHCLPAGIEPGALPLREYECRDPASGATGRIQVEVWKIPQASLPGEKQRFKFDREGFNKWRLHLVETGVIRPPLPHVLSAKRERIRDRLNNVSTGISAEVRKRLLAPKEAAVKLHDEAIAPGRKETA